MKISDSIAEGAVILSVYIICLLIKHSLQMAM